jgi:hypothetical protein
MSFAGRQAISQKRKTAHRPSGKRASLSWHISNIYQLTIKELRSIRSDPVMLVLVAYAFTIAIYTVATGASTEATNLAVGIVDEDRSDLSRRIADGLTRRCSSQQLISPLRRSTRRWTLDASSSSSRFRRSSKPTSSPAGRHPSR